MIQMDKKKNIFWIGMTSLFNDISSEMIMSLLPLFLTAIGASRSMIGLIEGVAEFTASIFKIISGWISDKLNMRKGLVIAGYSISTIFKPFIALANNWPQVMLARFADRTGKGIRNAPRDALVADSVDEKERGAAFGVQRGMDTFGAVIGTLCASGLLYLFGEFTSMQIVAQYRTIFWLSVIPGILAVLTVAFKVEEVKTVFKPQDGGKISVFKFGRGFALFLIVTALFELSNFSYAIFILRASSLGVVLALIPMLYLLYNLVYGFLSHPIGVLSDRVGKKYILFFGYMLFSLMCLGFAFAKHSLYAWLLFIVYGVVSAITQATPRALIADLTPKETRGTSYGVYYMLVGIIALPTSAIAGLLWDRFSVVLAFSYGSVLSAGAAVLLLACIPQKQN